MGIGPAFAIPPALQQAHSLPLDAFAYSCCPVGSGAFHGFHYTHTSNDIMKYPVPTPVLLYEQEQININRGLQPRPIVNTQFFPRLLSEAGLKVEDIDVYEINEAFASQATMCLSKSIGENGRVMMLQIESQRLGSLENLKPSSY